MTKQPGPTRDDIPTPGSVVDTHVHLFDLHHPVLRYAWLDPANAHPILTPDEVARIASSDYRLADFAAEARPVGVTKAVHVQAAIGTADPVAETAWLDAQSAEAGFPIAIVGFADLSADDLRDTLDRHAAASARFRGIRDFGPGTEYLDDPSWIAGVRVLGGRGLVLDLDCTWERMPLAEALAKKAPDTIIVLDHMGLPLSRDGDYRREWKRALTSLSKAQNVVCKISEFTMIDHDWDPGGVRPWLEDCLAAFGPERCVVGTNWPVDRLYAGYADVILLLRDVVGSLSPHERAAVLAGNAERVYRP